MFNRDQSRVLVLSSVFLLLAFGSVACTKNAGNPTGGASPENKAVQEQPENKEAQEQPEKPSSISKEYTELNAAISHMSKANFTEFKKDVNSAFDEISELIPRMLPSGKKLSSSAQSNITTIENQMKKIESAKTPEQVISYEKAGINSAVSALKDINSTEASKFPGLEQKLKNIQNSEKQINAKNYKQQSMVTFKQLSSTMQAMSNHFSKGQQKK